VRLPAKDPIELVITDTREWVPGGSDRAARCRYRRRGPACVADSHPDMVRYVHARAGGTGRASGEAGRTIDLRNLI